MEPVNQSAHVASPREQTVLKLFPVVDGAFRTLVDGLTDAIYASFQEQKMAMPTDADKRQRFKICMDWAIVLRGDLKWGIQRIIDAMPVILRTELSGTKWEPPTRQCWIPQDGR